MTMNPRPLSRVLLPVVVVAVAVAATGAPARAQSIVKPPAPGYFKPAAGILGAHPRLHFGASDLPAIKAKGLGGGKYFVDRMKGAFGGRMGAAGGPTGDWLDYLYGLWGQLSMDLLWIVQGDPAYADTAKKWALGYARSTSWRAAGVVDDLVPMEITTGMALTYDILHDRLSPGERGEIRAALKDVLDKIYPEFLVGDYWTQDFQNNHMHNRISGLGHAAIAILGDDPAIDVQKHADLAYWCYQQMRAWMPDDGSTHEGPGYWDYGFHWIVRNQQLFEHVTGVVPAATEHDRNHPAYRIYLLTPGMLNTFGLADTGGDGPAANLEAMLPSIARFKDTRTNAFMKEQFEKNTGGFYQQVGWGLLWYDATLATEPYTTWPLGRTFPDVDVVSVRSGWGVNDVGFVFKAGPPGGHKMQQMRGSGGTAWVNVAHDHPDQNHFLLWAHGKMLAVDDGYPSGDPPDAKLSSRHNTVLIDGQGGPREATGWYQPFDYAQTAFLRDAFIDGATAYAAGDASRLYLQGQKVVRHVAFVEGGYVMMIDELLGKGTGDHRFEWRLHKKGAWKKQSATEFSVADGTVSLDVRFLEPGGGALSSEFFPASGTAEPGLAVSTVGPQTRFSAVLVPQQMGAPVIASEARTATGGWGLRATNGAVSDLFGVASAPGAIKVDDIDAAGAAFLVHRQGPGVALALLTRGTSLTIAGVRTLGSDKPLDLGWRPGPAGGTLEVEPPYRTAGVKASVQIGGLRPGTGYLVTVAGAASGGVTTSAAGIATFGIDVSGRLTVVLAEGRAPDAGSGDGPAGGDGGAANRDGGAAGDGAGGGGGGCGCALGSTSHRGSAGVALALLLIAILRRPRAPRGRATR